MAQTLGFSQPREVFTTDISHIDFCLETDPFSQQFASFFTNVSTPEIPAQQQHLLDAIYNDELTDTFSADSLNLFSSTPLPSTTYMPTDAFASSEPNLSSDDVLDDDDFSVCEGSASWSPPSPQSSTSSSDVLSFSSRRSSIEEETEDDDETNATLPRCKVCGHKASGLHYGVNTCEACKGFFRRSLVCKAPYTCYGWSDCEISPSNRNCAYCRYQKCIKLGMSKTAIKIGRYSLRKKSENIEAIRQEKKVQSNSDNSALNAELLSRKVTEASLKHDQFYELKRYPEQLNRKMHEFNECSRLSNEAFGRKDTLSDAEYLSFYAATGLDLDGRREVIRHYGQMIHQSLSDQSEFVKSIPGFTQLSGPDQASLINASVFDFWLLCSYQCHDQQLKVGLFPSNLPYSLDWLNALLGYDFISTIFSLSTKLSQLGLKAEEVSLLKAVSLTFVDRADLLDREAVETLQWKLLRCLVHLLRRNHRATYNRKLYRIWNCILEMRSGTEIYQRVMNKLISEDWSKLREFKLCCETVPKIEVDSSSDSPSHCLEFLQTDNINSIF